MFVLEPKALRDERQDAILLQEVLRSKTFERTSSLRKLLTYLWQEHEQDISEYAIAVEALGRSADFDTKTDATVRVQIGRLRRLLEKFYADEGSQITRRLSVPVGTHQLSFVDFEEDAPSDPPTLHDLSNANLTTAERIPLPLPTIIHPIIPAPLGYSIFAALVLCTAVLIIGLLHRGQVASHGPAEMPSFWKVFLDNGKTTRIVLPAPIFFSWQPPDGRSVMVRDITVNDPSRWAESPVLASLLRKEPGPPKIWQGYTVASDTFASLQLARFLDSYGVRTSFSSSANSPHEIVDHENIVTFGTQSSLAAYQGDLDRLSFRMAIHEAKVTDLLSPPGRLREFTLIHESGSRDVTPGIVAVIPRGTDGSRIMLVQGSQTTALIAYLTSEEGMREMVNASQGMRTPFFEAVILSEVNSGTPLQSRLGAFRTFQERPNLNTKAAKTLQLIGNNVTFTTGN